jgi:hypothetical protein
MIELKTLDAEEMDQVTGILREYFVSRGFRVVVADHLVPAENTVCITAESTGKGERMISEIDLDDYLQLHHHKLYKIVLLGLCIKNGKVRADLWIMVKR